MWIDTWSDDDDDDDDIDGEQSELWWFTFSSSRRRYQAATITRLHLFIMTCCHQDAKTLLQLKTDIRKIIRYRPSDVCYLKFVSRIEMNRGKFFMHLHFSTIIHVIRTIILITAWQYATLNTRFLALKSFAPQPTQMSSVEYLTITNCR